MKAFPTNLLGRLSKMSGLGVLEIETKVRIILLVPRYNSNPAIPKPPGPAWVEIIAPA